MIEKIFLFPRKKTRDDQPDCDLVFKIDGQLVEVGSLWNNENEKGKYKSGKVKKGVNIAVEIEPGADDWKNKPKVAENDVVNLDEIPF